jgi:hypothetical protein
MNSRLDQIKLIINGKKKIDLKKKLVKKQFPI